MIMAMGMMMTAAVIQLVYKIMMFTLMPSLLLSVSPAGVVRSSSLLPSESTERMEIG